MYKFMWEMKCHDILDNVLIKNGIHEIFNNVLI